MARRRGARGNNQTPGLTVSAVEFYHIRGMEFAFKLRAILAHARQMQGNRILFYISGSPVRGNPFLTDSQGIAITPSIVLALQKGATDVEIMAQLENTQTAGLDRLPIPWPGRQQPKNPEQEALELERIRLDRAKLAHELAELNKQPSSLQKDLDEAKLKLEITRLGLQVQELQKQPSALEQQATEAEFQVKKTEAEKKIRDLTEKPDQDLAAMEKEVKLAALQTERLKAEKAKDEIAKGEPTKRLRPHKIIARAEGKDGEYKVIVFVFAEDGQPIKDLLVSIETDDYRTNDDGTIKPLPEIKFDEEERKVQVYAGEVTETLTLSGKPKWRKAPDIPAATDSDLQGSIWKVIKKAWKKGGELK